MLSGRDETVEKSKHKKTRGQMGPGFALLISMESMESIRP